MEPKYINLDELKGFVEYHKLTNRNSINQFSALVTIQIAKNKITKQAMNVGITFDGYENYGTVTLLESDIDLYLYPTVFLAQWLKMEHIESKFLKVTDTHKESKYWKI
jgi:hypothetical protein